MDRLEMIDTRLKTKPSRIDICKSITTKGNKATTNEEVEYICSKVDCNIITEMSFNNYRRCLNAFDHRGVLRISRLKWQSLTTLDLINNNIGDKGCKYLTRIHMPSLEQLFLFGNNIGDTGLFHLSKGKWAKLFTLSVSFIKEKGGDMMRVGGYSYLVRANWRYLKTLCMCRLDLSLEQAKSLLICQFPLTSMNLRSIYEWLSSLPSYIEAKFPKAHLII